MWAHTVRHAGEGERPAHRLVPSPPPTARRLTFCLTLVQLASVSLQRLWMVTLQAGRAGERG